MILYRPKTIYLKCLCRKLIWGKYPSTIILSGQATLALNGFESISLNHVLLFPYLSDDISRVKSHSIQVQGKKDDNCTSTSPSLNVSQNFSVKKPLMGFTSMGTRKKKHVTCTWKIKCLIPLHEILSSKSSPLLITHRSQKHPQAWWYLCN